MKGRAKKKPATVGVVEVPRGFLPLDQLELSPGDLCDVVEAGRPELLGAVYSGWLQRGHAFRVAGVTGFYWPGAAAHVRINRSPNKERKAEKVEEIDPLLKRFETLPLWGER